jgi:hypothetical protein
MADVNEQKDVNIQQEASESSPEAQSVDSATPPAEESSAVEVQRIPKPRFDEVIQQRNAARERELALEAKVRELEARQSGNSAKSQVDVVAARLVAELDMAPEAARKLAAIQLETAGEIAKSQTQELRAANHRNEIDSWSRGLAQKYGDYKDVAPAMEKVFGQLPPQTQDLVVSSPAGLEMLYSYAKAQLPSQAKSAFDKGAKQAYENKALKQAVSSSPGMGAGGGKAPLSRESIAKMPLSEYKERLSEINTWIQSQGSRRP